MRIILKFGRKAVAKLSPRIYPTQNSRAKGHGASKGPVVKLSRHLDAFLHVAEGSTLADDLLPGR